MSTSNFLPDAEEVKEYVSRYKLLYLGVGTILFIFVFRLWYLQILKGEELRRFSDKNRLKEIYMPAPRGMVFDREGRIIVDNKPGFIATITPQYAKKLKQTANAVSEILDIPSQTIISQVKKSRKRNGYSWPYRVKENLSRDEIGRLERIRLDHPGLDIDMVILRNYLLKDNGAQLFGYVAEISRGELTKLNKNKKASERFRQGDIIGKSGLEQVFNRDLTGDRGLEFIQIDARGRKGQALKVDFLKGVDSYDSIPGYNIILTIDKDLQEAAYDAFNKSDRLGALIAMDPRSGEILAWVNSPSFDPNEFSRGISSELWRKLAEDPFRALRNKVIQTHGAPGSTFKAIVGLAGLEEKVINESTTHFCPGFIKFGRRRYHCNARYGHGNVNIVQALERSCNVFFYKLGISLGIDRMAKYASLLGFGKKTQLNLKGELRGLVPTTDWKRKARGEEWQPGENLSNAIGQGFILSTPIQLAAAFAAISMEGPRFKPNIIKKIVDTEGRIIRDFQPLLIEDVSQTEKVSIKKKNFKIIKKGLHAVMHGEKGTARWYKIPGVTMGGKTGTSQLFSLTSEQLYKKCDERPIHQRHHGWFVGFAPVENPEIVVAVLAEHSCAGSRGGGKPARAVIKAYFDKYHPKENDKEKKVATQ